MTAASLVALGGLLVLVLCWLRVRFAGFTAQSPADYAGHEPALDLRRDLNGPIACDGVIYGPMGRVVSRFSGDFEVTWNGNTGVMKEHFRYDDGSTRDREWKLRVGNDGRIEATAPDVVGAGTGILCGPALQLKYRICMPEDSGGHVLDTVDWMYLSPDGTIVNRSQFRKFGIKVAELIATMRPRDGDSRPNEAT